MKSLLESINESSLSFSPFEKKLIIKGLKELVKNGEYDEEMIELIISRLE